MPGTPDPVLGSDALTTAVACAAGALAVALAVALRDRVPAVRLVVGGGAAHALLGLGAWAGARLAADAFVASLFDDVAALAGLVAVAGFVLWVQAAIPLYLYARAGLRAPLAGLFGGTALVLDVFLRVGGESDPLALYPLLFGPGAVVAVCVLGLAEFGASALVGRFRGA